MAKKKAKANTKSIDFIRQKPPVADLEYAQLEMLEQHYQRCSDFWRHWTATIAAVPSIATAINGGALLLLFDRLAGSSVLLRFVIALTLVALNASLFLWLRRLQCMRRGFGGRLVEVERYCGIEPVNLDGSDWFNRRASSSWFIAAMGIILLLSVGVLAYYFVEMVGLISTAERAAAGG
jgi:hypothetical protein